MAWSQDDLDKLRNAVLAGVKSVTYADGRRVEYHTLDEMRGLIKDMKEELAAAASQVSPRVRTVVGRMCRDVRR